jgi:hypothetical protein
LGFLLLLSSGKKGSAKYRIRVRGELHKSWSERLGGMKITVERYEYKNPVTVLMGLLRDQASLTGVLNTLNDMHYDVLSVEKMESVD